MDASKKVIIVLIGPTQSGKSTFLKLAQSFADGEPGEEVLVGNGGKSCTVIPSIREFTLRLRDWKLVDFAGGDIPIPDDESQLFSRFWKQKNYEVVPVPGSEQSINLLVIDTPGLDDSENRDAQHIEKVLRLVQKQPYVSSIAFICGCNVAFSSGFQQIYQQYSRCMPNLMSPGALAVINTQFSVRTWAQKHQRYVDDGEIELQPESYGSHLVGRVSGIGSSLGKTAKGMVKRRKSAKELAIEKRRAAFKAVFDSDPVHFFIDSVPNSRSPFEQMVTMNSFAEIMRFLSSKGSMPTDQMQLCKSPQMLNVDRRLAQLLIALKSSWEKEQSKQQAIAVKLGDRTILARTSMAKSIATAKREIKECEEQLAKKNNETRMNLRSNIKTHDDVSMPNRLWKGMTAQRFKGQGIVVEETVKHFFVDTEDGQYSRWEGKEKGPFHKKWQCDYWADWARKPDMKASSWTYNKWWYADQIADLEGRLSDKRPELETLEETLADYDVPDENESEQHTMIKRLTEDIADVEQLIKELRRDTVPLAVGFNAAAEARYAKEENNIDISDVLAALHSCGMEHNDTHVVAAMRQLK